MVNRVYPKGSPCNPTQPIPLHFLKNSIPIARPFPRKIGKRPSCIPIYIFETKSVLLATQ